MSRDSNAEVNPYAPSAVAAPYSGASELGVGVWRDGNLLVMHRDATLPAICLKTGAPASHWLVQKIGWQDSWFAITSHQYELRLPLSARRYWLATRLRWWLLGLGAVAILLLVVVGMQLDRLPDGISPRQSIFGVASLAVTLFVVAYNVGTAVTPRRFRGDYIWLSGADSRFLAQLPPWPGG